ncbi:hypothetical protein BRD17_09020 [Halobacteriales archaeon SW_7_68_16]|nr:MAG: hypothetical protein BRD17_09020 [Halobacteriales archaeon SW_7_68_16]
MGVREIIDDAARHTVSETGIRLLAILSVVRIAEAIATQSMLAQLPPSLLEGPTSLYRGTSTPLAVAIPWQAAAVVAIVSFVATFVVAVVAIRRFGADGGTGERSTGRALLQWTVVTVVLVATIALGSVLLVLPGLVAAVVFSFAPVVAVVEDASVVEAFRRSWETVTEHWKTVLPLYLGLAVIAVAWLIVGGLGTVALSTILPVLGDVFAPVVPATFIVFVLAIQTRAFVRLGTEGTDTPVEGVDNELLP